MSPNDVYHDAPRERYDAIIGNDIHFIVGEVQQLGNLEKDKRGVVEDGADHSMK